MRSLSSTTSSASDEIVSRFRLQASFTVNCDNFIPYEYIEHESINSDRMCLRASRTSDILLTPAVKSSNLPPQLQVKGRVELRIPKRKYVGYLNVEDPHAQHNWNRRWCTLDGFTLQVWRDENILNASPLFCLNLHANPQVFLKLAPRDLCARPRSFCLECTISKEAEDAYTAVVFFAADTESDLHVWLDCLNREICFINNWLF